jgi:dephospho-CoA kinase
MIDWKKKAQELEAEVERLHSELLNHQRDRLGLLKVLRNHSEALEREQELTKRLTKSLIAKKKKKKK